MAKPRVLLLCGGQSEEHEVSLASARSVVAAAGDKLSVTPRVLDKKGGLLSPEASLQALSDGKTQTSATGQQLQALEPNTFDVVFPLLHGPYGEDGTVQGLFKLMGLPFVGSGVLGSAVGMDKLMMKAVFAAYGLPQVPYRAVNRSRWQDAPEEVWRDLEPLQYPLFVKPANLGSSVGIGKAVDAKSLRSALDEAAKYDRRIIVEQGIVGVRELEVGILGNDAPQASPVGEIGYQTDFYDYASKYTEGAAELHIPAQVSEDISERCRSIALDAFRAVDAAGLARVDFFFEEATGELYLNEINTMPGFTVTSMYPKLWEAGGVGYAELVERLVALALAKR